MFLVLPSHSTTYLLEMYSVAILILFLPDSDSFIVIRKVRIIHGNLLCVFFFLTMVDFVFGVHRRNTKLAY